MSSALERLGRFAARCPWIVIGSWVAIGFLVITSAASFGRDLDDPVLVAFPCNFCAASTY